MGSSFDYLNTFYDKIYVLTLPRLQERITLLKQQLQGLNYELFTGIDKEDTSIAELKSQGLYSTERYRQFYKMPEEMSLGMLCCSLGHVAMYRDIIANGYKQTLILEDDVVPAMQNMQLFPAITSELPANWEICYLGYERNETLGWRQQVKKVVYMTYPYHAQLRLTREIYSNYYPRSVSEHISKAGFHDCTHAYSITLEGAKKLLALQQPVAFNPDNLLSYAICTGLVSGYITKPKLFNQLTAFVHSMPSQTRD